MKIAILGGGCWGTTLACHLYHKGNEIALWEYDRKKAEILEETRRLKFLPGLTIPKEIFISSNLADVVGNKEVIVFALPSSFFRLTVKKVFALLNQSSAIKKIKMLVSGTKGLENNSFSLMSQILEEESPPQLHSKIVVLSGPSHAEEVSQNIPTAVTVAGRNWRKVGEAQKLFFTPFFRVYSNSDFIGVQLAAALKNIYAIACGISDGLGLGDNTKAALVTRGLAEMVRLAKKFGAKVSTFYGLAGIGDLMVTCFSNWSRNHNFGEKLGQGKSVRKALEEIKMTVEGIGTTKAVYSLAKKMGVNMPIVNEVYSILYQNHKPEEAMQNLLMRKAKSELT